MKKRTKLLGKALGETLLSFILPIPIAIGILMIAPAILGFFTLGLGFFLYGVVPDFIDFILSYWWQYTLIFGVGLFFIKALPLWLQYSGVKKDKAEITIHLGQVYLVLVCMIFLLSIFSFDSIICQELLKVQMSNSTRGISGAFCQ